MENIESFEKREGDAEQRRREILQAVGYPNIKALEQDIQDFSDNPQLEDCIAYLKEVVKQLKEIR